MSSGANGDVEASAVEALARNVLCAAGLVKKAAAPAAAAPITSQAATSQNTSYSTTRTRTSNGAGDQGYLSRLERAAGCYLAPLPPIVSATTEDGSDGGSSGILTCTDPNEGNKKRPASDVWNPLDAVSSAAGGVSMEVCDYNNINDNDDADDCLEDMVPFPSDFYRCVGELLCECFAPGSRGDQQRRAVPVGGDTIGSNEHDHDTETRYSLPRDNDAVRATRLLCALMEFNVDDTGELDGEAGGGSGSGCSSFLSLLLRHCEGNRANLDTSARVSSSGGSAEAVDDGGGSDDDIGSTGKGSPDSKNVVKKMSRVPIISAAFHHLSSLPSLEAYVRSQARRRSYSQQSRSVAIDATVTLATPSSTTQLSSDAASDRLRSMKMWEKEKNRLEAELTGHTAMLEFVIGSIYKECDAELRGRCRTKLGSLLHVFALSSGGPAPMARHVGSGSFVAGVVAGPGLMGIEDASAAAIDATLKILLRVVEGIDRRSLHQLEQPILGPSHQSLLFDILIPLHKPSGMVLWRDQTPVLGLFHETLVRCIGALLVRNRQLIAKVVRALLHPDIWPTEGGTKARGAGGPGVVANTPKVVLLLHEVDTYLGLLDMAPTKGDSTSNERATDEESALVSSFSETILPLTVRLASCIESDNSRTSERALQYFRNPQFAFLIRCYKEVIMPVLLRALCRMDTGMQVPWNPTVRKMTLLVLTELEAIDEELFQRSCEDAFGAKHHRQHMRHVNTATSTSTADGMLRSGSAMVGHGSASGDITQDMTSLRGGMGNWRPPTVAGTGSSKRPQAQRTRTEAGIPRTGGGRPQPPLTVTGVAPWAAGGGSQQPPLTVTGVAPWAVGGERTRTSTSALRAGVQRPTKTKQPGRGTAPWACAPRVPGGPLINKIKTEGLTQTAVNPTEVEDTAAKEGQLQESSVSSGLQRVQRYMKELMPPKVDGEDDSDGVSSWAKAQMAESPTLLPDLKFHDLVFGQNLGEGSFGTVRYARQIMKDRTRSSWPEFAVKVVSTRKITELGYEQSINREIAILRTMSHPGIARLISSFRFRDGAYLVLEYASGGDLHTLLKRNGSIDHASTQFVIGEIVAALSSIHDAGFVYGDLKPENCLITESGHIKLTDFGGCRPFTDQANAMVKLSSTNVIKQLRDGDWKEPPKSTTKTSDDNEGFVIDEHNMNSEIDGKNSSIVNDEEEAEDNEEDFRIEGTTAYLPPEVVVGNIPTTAADSWALGCVLYQCVSGRPPILEDTDHLTKHKIVTFELSSTSHEENFFGIHDESTFTPDAKELIRKLLSRNPVDRPEMHSVAHDNFFGGKDVFDMHKQEAYPLDVGSVAPVADAKWNRRQFSSIWAPQPKQYAIDSLSNSDVGSTAWDRERNSPIREGLERESPFLVHRRATALMQIGE